MHDDLRAFLPDDGFAGTLVGRAWLPATLTGSEPGPSPVWIREDGVFDLSPIAATTSELFANGTAWRRNGTASLSRVGSFEELMAATVAQPRDDDAPRWLAPVDLQPIKACGVTFMVSALERVIEERAGGDSSRAEAVRAQIKERIGAEVSSVVPGSPEAEQVKQVLQQEGLWSQYLEVGIGPDAEVFTKAQALSAVGTGDDVGILEISSWNNPEPEVVLIVDPAAEIVGATLGNDVNLRDIEGRSALLLGKAKDNNGSAAIGPFVRLFDETFTLDDVRRAEVSLEITGDDGFTLREVSPMSSISRDVTELVAQTIHASHQYPDGIALFTGTLFAPTADRDAEGQGFTHHLGDLVRISSPKFGTLQNRVQHCHTIPPWRFGLTALMHNLARRGLLPT
jgi:fumarylacetoacetate (FAA) hydrolase family protein